MAFDESFQRKTTPTKELYANNRTNSDRTPNGVSDRTNSQTSAIISKEEFLLIDPSEIEIFVIKPVKKIVALLSHTVFIISFN